MRGASESLIDNHESRLYEILAVSLLLEHQLFEARASIRRRATAG
jgi:hypothetical protein